eukprot:143464-Rhodomonas_salina.1
MITRMRFRRYRRQSWRRRRRKTRRTRSGPTTWRPSRVLMTKSIQLHKFTRNGLSTSMTAKSPQRSTSSGR